ncbi:hypothetical protein BIV57_06325 [Mangrovactinospora gilvigrisea]|uniref:Uncharacterized protein n=1 Tax=Mangrovactinospora gilvigrisea TaxID=1428644 RepID=A0A1J7BXQ9_9ACTN|nr:hypothetical protein [Mangrovactinospora gilvigrisea]OIV38281.1 hypothetical protein BIV57_06325 [Mangrovactinospora gilvigrisea]
MDTEVRITIEGYPNEAENGEQLAKLRRWLQQEPGLVEHAEQRAAPGSDRDHLSVEAVVLLKLVEDVGIGLLVRSALAWLDRRKQPCDVQVTVPPQADGPRRSEEWPDYCAEPDEARLTIIVPPEMVRIEVPASVPTKELDELIRRLTDHQDTGAAR